MAVDLRFDGLDGRVERGPRRRHRSGALRLRSGARARDCGCLKVDPEGPYRRDVLRPSLSRANGRMGPRIRNADASRRRARPRASGHGRSSSGADRTWVVRPLALAPRANGRWTGGRSGAGAETPRGDGSIGLRSARAPRCVRATVTTEAGARSARPARSPSGRSASSSRRAGERGAGVAMRFEEPPQLADAGRAVVAFRERRSPAGRRRRCASASAAACRPVGSYRYARPPVIPAPKFAPTGPRTTTVPPVMYSQPCGPIPSTTASAPRCGPRSASPPGRRGGAGRPVAPYRTVLPAIASRRGVGGEVRFRARP